VGERVVGIPTDSWLRYEAAYRADLARIADQETLAARVDDIDPMRPRISVHSGQLSLAFHLLCCSCRRASGDVRQGMASGPAGSHVEVAPRRV